MKVVYLWLVPVNFRKLHLFWKAVKSFNLEHDNYIDQILVHTGQHYDIRMSEAFKALDIPEPDINLEIGSGSHAEQSQPYNDRIRERCFSGRNPTGVVVVGDVNATLSCSVVAKN